MYHSNFSFVPHWLSLVLYGLYIQGNRVFDFFSPLPYAVYQITVFTAQNSYWIARLSAALLLKSAAGIDLFALPGLPLPLLLVR